MGKRDFPIFIQMCWNVTVNVGAAGTVQPVLDPQAIQALANLAADAAARPPLAAEPSILTFDTVSTLLHELSAPAIQNLLQTVDRIIETRLSLAAPEHFPSIHAPAAATPASTGFELIQTRETAEKSVAKALHAIETSGSHGSQIPDNVNPRLVISVANQFIETGQIPNYLRAEELGRIVAGWYQAPVPSDASLAVEGRRSRGQAVPVWQIPRLLKRLWRRAPLLVLLALWLLAGTVAELLPRSWHSPPVELWATGFLALVVFQFLFTVRNALRPKPSRRFQNPAADR